MFFSLVRKERKGQKEEGIPLLNTFRRLAATSANKVLRPSHYSIATATGSKRSSADSDLLLCHVRLWRTSRLSFWRKYGCEHSEIGFVSAIYCSNTSSVAVNRATFCPCLGDADRVRLRESVNSPQEKAGENPCFRRRTGSAHARHTFFSGRADNACTNLLGSFV